MTTMKPVKIGVLGLGMAGGGIIRSLARSPEVSIAAAVSSRPAARAAFSDQFHGRGYESLDELCRDPEIEAVWVATPSEYHCEHAIALANHGKHIVMEKPFAMSLAECEKMIEAAERNKVVLIGGGSHSFNPAYISMREIVTSGRLGGLGALADWSFSDWMLRAREPHEVENDRDGGALLNQGPHPVDALRLLGGGMLRSVRATTRDFGLRGRPCAGYFCAYMEFEDGTPATLVYDGYGYIHGWEGVAWGETDARVDGSKEQYAYRRRLRNGTADELPAREQYRFGAPAEAPSRAGADGSWVPSGPGNIVVTCERGEIRQAAAGLYVYDDDGRHEEPFSAGGNVRFNEATELRRGMASEPIFRDGRWGMATTEVVLAIAESAAQRREIYLEHQVPVVDALLG